jgi:hypothetical protein
MPKQHLKFGGRMLENDHEGVADNPATDPALE